MSGVLSFSLPLSPRPYYTYTKQAGAYYNHPNQGAQPPGRKEPSANCAKGRNLFHLPPYLHYTGQSYTPNSRNPLGCKKMKTSLHDQFVTRWVLSLPSSLPGSVSLSRVEAEQVQWDIFFLPLAEELAYSEGTCPLGVTLKLNSCCFPIHTTSYLFIFYLVFKVRLKTHKKYQTSFLFWFPTAGVFKLILKICMLSFKDKIKAILTVVE